MSNNLIEKVEKLILNEKLISKGDRLVVAVSGGPDSITLLNILNYLSKKIDFEIVVAHVNHKIRNESEEEKVYVQKYCENLKVPFFYFEADVLKEAKLNKMGTEEYARKIRYDFFYNVKEEIKADKIAVAHNLNDKVETIMLNLIRGCSSKGLVGMEYISNDIIRPLIDIPKSEILKFCTENNLNPCIDKTNFEPIYTRNKIRLQLIPMMEEINPNFIYCMDRMSTLVKEDEDFIDKYVEKIVNESIVSKEKDNIIFNYKNIISEHIAVKTRSVRKIVHKLLNNVQGIEKKHILDIIKLLEHNITNKKYIIGNKFTIVILKKNIAKIYLNY